MISSVSIHHNSFANDLMWRTHFPVKQESLDDSASNISPEIYADTENELDQQKTRPEHLAGFIPPTISSSPTVPSQQGIYVSPTYQQRDLSCHFRASPSRISPYPMRSSPNIPHSKTSSTFHSPNSILSSPSPSGFYHQKISPSGCEVYGASTPDKSRASPGTNSDVYRTSPNISSDFHRGSPTSHISGASSSFGSDLFQSPHSYPHLPQSALSMGITPDDIYRSLNGPKTSYDSHTISPRSNLGICDEPLNMNSMQVDLSQRLSPQQHSPSYLGNNRTSPISNDPQRVSPYQVSSERKLSPPSMINQESHDSSDSRSPSPPVQNLKMMLQKTSSQEFWTASTGNSEAHISEIEAATDVPSNSLKCYFCSYNTKSRIQLNKHMRDAHTESKIMPSNENETDEDNENETHSNLSEDFMMDEYDDEDGECDEFAVNINKVSQNANSNKRTSYKCKKCALTFKNKDEYYVHQRDNHIKREKLLECKLCPFVTEYKHHHEYHIKNHFKMKPFKCSYSNCKYSCNNQSMLNSHVKSHKSFYQFHCKNCNYATKYMHSFKLHLRKNNHEKGITLNEDGSVNNDIIIDIHGTRRGPKRKSRKLDENALQNINNNNCITQTIKKTIHQEPETEYNNNVTMSSNNGSSRSNSPLSNVNYNNNNNDSYYLNTKLFVYSHMASMINEKTPEIWVKDTNTLVDNFKQLSNVHDDIPEVVDLSESAEEPSEMQVDTEAPLDLSKTVDIKPQHNAMDLVKTGVSNTMETIQNQDVSNVGVFNGNQKIVDSSQSLIKIENRVKTSADMIRIVGKNNYDIEHGNIFKNKNKIKLCKNNEKSLKNVFEKMKTGNVRSSSSRESVTILEPNVELIDQTNEIIIEDNKTKNCDQTEEKTLDLGNEISIDITTNDAVSENPKKSPTEEFLSEANKQAISTNKNRRRKGKAYKLQINNEYVEQNINSELKDEEVAINVVANSPTVDSVSKTVSEMAGKEQTTIPSSYEIQMDYLKQIQSQYLKTFQQNKCVDNCAVPLLPQNNNINNNVNSSQLFDAKSQLLSNFSQKSGLDFVGSHLKNLERINSHLLQNSLNMSSRKKSEGLKPIDNIFHNKSEDQFNILNPYLAKRNEANLSVTNNNRLWYKCELCDIQYLDELIYSIHMRYHNIEHPYKCNLCGLQTNNKFQFNLHIIQTPH